MSRRLRMVILALMLLAYVGSYLAISRHGFAEADQYNIKGFYFFLPTDDMGQWANGFCKCFYYPCVVVDNLLGTGRELANDPCLGLSIWRSRRIRMGIMAE